MWAGPGSFCIPLSAVSDQPDSLCSVLSAGGSWLATASQRIAGVICNVTGGSRTGNDRLRHQRILVNIRRWNQGLKPPTVGMPGEESQWAPRLLSWLKAGALHWGVLSVVLNLLLLLLLIILTAQPAKQCDPCPATPACPVATCPDGWIGHLGKCYYFSEAEANWPSSQSYCSAFNTSLAAIDTQQELNFMMRYEGFFDYWIGLHRDPSQLWKWTNGTEFNNCLA